MRSRLQDGFSAVELLITLFIAFLFITMGYQLYSVTINDGSSTRAKARANNLAYTQMRLSAESAFSLTCPGSPQVTTTSVDSGRATQTVTISCPNANLPNNLRLVTVRVVYSTPSVEATHATYVQQ